MTDASTTGAAPAHPPADLERRFAAYAIDRVLAWGISAGLGVGLGRLLAPDEPWVGVGIGVGVLLLFGLCTAVLLGTTSLTPGMALTGLRVVRADGGGAIGVGPALLRTLVLGLAGLPTLGLGVATLAWTAAMDPSGRRRARHDAIGGAMVVDVRPRPVAEEVVEDRPQPIVNLTAMRLLPATARDAAPTPPETPAPAPTSTPGPAPSQRPATPPPAARPPASPTPSPTPSRPPGPPAPPAPAAPVSPGPTPRDASPPVERPATPAAAGRPAAAVPVPEASTRRRDLLPTARWRVTFDTGETFVVEGLAVLGRRPEPREGEPVRHLVALPSQDMSLSKTHAQFQVVPDGALVVMDRGSTNGSHVMRGGASKSLAPGRPATLLDGDVVKFGDRTMQVLREA